MHITHRHNNLPIGIEITLVTKVLYNYNNILPILNVNFYYKLKQFLCLIKMHPVFYSFTLKLTYARP